MMTPAAPDFSHADARRREFGFSLLEMLMVMAIVAMLAALVIPSMTTDERIRLDAAAAVLVSDIELAQVMSITAPKDPIVVRFDSTANAYWLALEESPEVPMMRAGTNEPYYVVLGEGRTLSAAGVTLHVDGLADDTLRFSSQGGLTDPNAKPLISFRWGGKNPRYQTQITIAPTTGTINVEQMLIAK